VTTDNTQVSAALRRRREQKRVLATRHPGVSVAPSPNASVEKNAAHFIQKQTMFYGTNSTFQPTQVHHLPPLYRPFIKILFASIAKLFYIRIS
jgi:hypothetical protein